MNFIYHLSFVSYMKEEKNDVNKHHEISVENGTKTRKFCFCQLLSHCACENIQPACHVHWPVTQPLFPIDRVTNRAYPCSNVSFPTEFFNIQRKSVTKGRGHL